MKSNKSSLLIAIVVFAGTPPAHADSVLSLDPMLTLRYGYNSNLRLETEEELETMRASVDAGVKWGRRTETSQLDAEFHWIWLDYDEAEFANTDDLTARISYANQFERTGVRLATAAARENVLTTEIEDTGFADIGVQRERLIGSGGFDYQSSLRTRWGVEFGLETAEYEQSDRYVDYDYDSVSLYRARDLSSKSGFTMRAEYADFETDDGFTKSETVSLNLEYKSRLSETLSWHAGFGRNRTRSVDTFIFFVFPIVQTSEDYGWNADLGLRKQWQYTTLSLQAGQSVRPSGQGALVNRRSLNVSLRHDLSDFVSIRLAGGLRSFEDTNTLTRSGNDRTFSQVALAMDFALSRNWRLSSEFSHRTQEFERRDDAASGSIVSLTLSYSPSPGEAG